MKLIQEDIEKIESLQEEILTKAGSLTLDSLDLLSKGRMSQMFVAADCEKMKEEERKSTEKYSFYSENEVNVALYLFFTNKYNAKRIARSCYVLDEDEKFNESMAMDIPLGRVVLPNGGIVTTSIVEAILKVREYDNRNPITGMPFDIVAFRLMRE